MHLLTRLRALRDFRALRHRRARRARDQRGDVPGWVLITVMTVSIGTAIWAVARPELVGMLRAALSSVG